ncbi:hypothetical protein C1645_814518 [Glomus cerebriforme]|uniref:Uncharacterized protein n=1 Tax=Glomus cerebriforme TaxID=658196 RepID=A0A397TFT9_9GLOM|nr:hypothetical protein C1645_814518 [Glomus cerebriforme]
MEKKKKDKTRYSREHNTNRLTPYSSEIDYRSYSPRGGYHKRRSYYGGRAFEDSYPVHFKYNQQISPCGSPSKFNSFLLNDIINEPSVRSKPKIPTYSPENEELWKYYRVKEGSLLRENEIVLRKDVRAMERALKDSLQSYEREIRCHALIKRQIDVLFTPEEIEELNLIAEKNNKNDPLSL